MAAETSFKLKADIGPFKTAMTEAKAATKTLDAELKLAQAQFKATGDAEQYLDTRSKVLAQQMTQQQKAADAARSALEQMRNAGVEPTSTAYQNMERSLYEAERQLVQLRQEADKTGNEVLDLSKDSDKLAKSLDEIGKSTRFSAIANGFQSIATIAQTVWSTVQRIGRTIGDSADWADELGTTAKRYGLSTTELQQYQYAARFVDTEVESILKARDKLMQKAKGEDFLSLIDGMDQYAVKLKDQNGDVRDSMDVFWDFIDVLGEFKNETERDTVAQEYFGKSFRDLNTLVEAGRSGWEKYMSEADVVDDGTISKLQQLDDSLEKLDSKWNALKNTAVAGFAPAITAALDGILWSINNVLSAWDALNRAFGGDGILPSTYTESEFMANWNATSNGAPMKKVYNAEALAADVGEESAQATVSAYAAGVEANVSAAYAAGAALGAAAAQGVGAGAGAVGNTTNNNTTQNFGDTYNYYSNGYEGYTEAQRRALAGYGG